MIADLQRATRAPASYRFQAHELSSGSTLGSPKAVAVVKATGALEKLYAPDAGTDVFGTLLVRHWDAASGVALRRRSGRTTIAPESEEHDVEYSGGLAVRERIFVLSTQPRGEDHHEVDPPAAYYDVELRNEGDCPIEIATYAGIRLRGGFQQEATSSYDPRLRAFVAHSADQPKTVRIAGCTVEPASYEVTMDVAKISAAYFPGTLGNDVATRAQDPIGIFHVFNRLEPGARAAFCFVLTFSTDGEAAARNVFAALPEPEAALERTRAYYQATLDRAVVVTPEPEVNRGVAWAKVNMQRSLLLARTGWCFVNDPTETTKSVARDTSWFALGADYVFPWFVRDSLRWYADHLTDEGMVVEWYDSRDEKTETYGLDVNDNTPLLILALRHHFCVTGDREFLEEVYPKALRAGRFLLGRRGKHGLIWCHAEGTGSRGVVGWRNAIQGYRLAGATTELNSECYAALGAVSLLAEEMGDTAVRDEFARAAHELRASINEHLLDRASGLYYLTIDDAGRAQTDVTSDMVFPILFGVAEDDVAAHLIATLSRPEFWSDAGLRTVARNAMNYSPVDGSGLLGGVWAGPTFWFACAAARYDTELMADALTITFRHFAEDPLRYNTVPGQFCEWLHGETLTNQGMMLSPWFAPKYLWAAIEGAAGLSADLKQIAVDARLPEHWHWLGVRNVNLRGQNTSWFTVRMHGLKTYATTSIASVDARRRYETDVSDDVRAAGEDVEIVALARGDELAILLGNTVDRTVSTAAIVGDVPLPHRVHVRVYNSLAREWASCDDVESGRLRDGFPVELDRQGFCVLEISPVPS